MPPADQLFDALPISPFDEPCGAGEVQDLPGRASNSPLGTFENWIPGSLQKSEACFPASLIDSAPVLIWMAGPDQSHEYFNQRWLDFTGRTLEQERGSGWTDGLHPDDREQIILSFREAFETHRQYEVECRLRRYDGPYRWMLAAGAPRFAADGRFLGYIGACVDITDRKQAQFEMQELLAASDQAHAQLAEQAQHLHQLAESDPLTGMLNRRSFRDQFRREWDRAVRYERAIACIMLDIDFFKNVNDTHGHAAGDAVLKRVAELLIRQCRPSDRVCRYGGEEFCIVAPETTETGAATLAERLRVKMAATPVIVGDTSIWIASSFGVAERTCDMGEMDNLIERADQALRIAKHSGRNLVVGFACNKLAESFSRGSPSRELSRVTARELATPITCIRSDETIQFAVKFLLHHKIASAPVVDASGTLVGCISDRDLLMVDLTRGNSSRQVCELMKTNVVSYEESVPGDQVYQFLCRVSIQQVVVVKDARPTGVINTNSLLNFVQHRVGT